MKAVNRLGCHRVFDGLTRDGVDWFADQSKQTQTCKSPQMMSKTPMTLAALDGGARLMYEGTPVGISVVQKA